MKNKKSQIQTQVFIYIFAVIIVMLIVFFGVKAIGKFSKDTEQVSLVNFEKELKVSLSSSASEYNSVRRVELSLPSEFLEVCFSDSNAEANSINSQSSKYPEIVQEVNSQTGNNVFIMKKTLAKPIATETVVDVVADNSFFCAKNERGRISFMATGKGRYVQISKI